MEPRSKTLIALLNGLGPHQSCSGWIAIPTYEQSLMNGSMLWGVLPESRAQDDLSLKRGEDDG